jgi:hypothetical protein
MQNAVIITFFTAAALSIIFLQLAYAQLQSAIDGAPDGSLSSNVTDSVLVEASAVIEVNNSTLQAKEKMLRTAIVNFLTSGPNALKAMPEDQPIVKTKIVNQINNATQSVEGIEATNAIIGVEISKMLRTVLSSSNQQNKNAIVIMQTSSTCSPINVEISCENTVIMKR